MSLDTINPRVREKLIEVARQDGLINYWDLGHACDVDHHLGLNRELGRISRDCAQRGEPLLSALVVNKEKNLPGEGFFEQATEFAGYNGSGNEGDRRRWWQSYLPEVRGYWQARERQDAQ